MFFFCLIACDPHNQNQYNVRTYNADDLAIIYVNQHIVVQKTYGGGDSGFVNVNSYLITGVNNFTFTDYNGNGPYGWAFELKKDSTIIFSNSNAGNGISNQIVYNNTILISICV